MQNHEEFETLLMKAVDGKLSPAESELLDDHLSGCSRCRDELEDFRRIKERTDMLSSRIMRDASIIPPRESLGRLRVVMAATWTFVAGLVMLLGYSIYLFLSEDEIPVIVRIATALLATGTLVLASLAVHQRLRGQSRDPYREIDL